MPLLILASATEIAQWAATRASQDRVPELLRRLIYGTTDASRYVDFPSGDAVHLDGWDGVAELDEDHATIPRGLSVWEIGTSANPKGKADDDYIKRTAAPPDTARGPVQPSDTTFVFVTPRRWGLYLLALGHFERPPRILHSAMAKNPDLFVDVVKTAFGSPDEDSDETQVRDSELVNRAYHLLHSWREIPGSTAQGIDETALNEWIDVARDGLRAVGLFDTGDHMIGQTLSVRVADADGAWPRIPIRNLVERLESEKFEQGLLIGRYNTRGVISRNPLGGGDIERGEVHAYEAMATTVATRWPRTAVLLRRMAKSSRADATRVDVDSELREDLEG
ncbi:MAG: hypothetical protein ABJF01_26165 [bacterium]